MKKLLTTALLASAMSLSVTASDEFSVTPLIGIDMGYISMAADAPNTEIDGANDGGLVGLKLGARNEHYRVYFDAKAYIIPDFDYANSLGGQIQYIIPLTDSGSFEIYLGANGGMMNMKYDSPQGSRMVSQPYMGGDLGLNFQVSESIGLEFGVKYLSLNIEHSLGDGTPVSNTIDGMFNAGFAVTFALPAEKPFAR